MVCIYNMPDFNFILAQFGLPRAANVGTIKSGLINQTWLAETSAGKFVIQKLHPIVRTETCRDAKVVTDFLNTAGVKCPEFLLSREGAPFLEYEGGLYRVMKYIEGQTFDTIKSTAHAFSAAGLMKQMHRAMGSLDYKCIGSIPHFHDTEFIFEQFKKVLRAPEHAALTKTVSADIQTILQEVPAQLLPSNLPQQIIHGDPKISNFLFDGEKAIAILDFDTCLTHSPLIDIGDALRSWCNLSGEDSGDALFDKEIYDAAREGYLSGLNGAPNGTNSTEQFTKLIPQAFRLLVIEQAMRFLKDYFEDNYYGWDPARFDSRREHNLVRARNQLSLYRQIRGL